MLDLSKEKLELIISNLWDKFIGRLDAYYTKDEVDNITSDDIGAAEADHTHGYAKTVTLSTTEPTAVADGEVVMIYEE